MTVKCNIKRKEILYETGRVQEKDFRFKAKSSLDVPIKDHTIPAGQKTATASNSNQQQNLVQTKRSQVQKEKSMDNTQTKKLSREKPKDKIVYSKIADLVQRDKEKFKQKKNTNC